MQAHSPEKRTKALSTSPRKRRKQTKNPQSPPGEIQPRIPTTVSTRSGGGTRRSIDKTEAEKELYSLKKRKMRMVKEEIEQEHKKEYERSELMESVTSGKERRRLEKIFSMERAQANDRIQDLSARFDQEIERVRKMCQDASVSK